MTKARTLADNFAADINAITAGTGITGGGTSGTVTVTNSMATEIDAKGDLVVGTGADTFARLAVSDNGSTLVADSSTTTGLRWQGNYAAGKNKIINGDFNIWQRGTTFTDPASGTYLADRFAIGYNGTGSSRTLSQQTFTPGTAPVAGYESQFFLRCNTTNAGSGNTSLLIRQAIEDVRTFAGETVTFSFWMKSGTTGKNCEIDFTQNFGSGGSSLVDGTNVSFTSSNNWTRHSFVIAIPSVSGKTIGAGSHINFRIFFEPGIIESFDIWGWQVEAGSVATAFQTATGTLAGELAACQRYYYRQAPSAVFGNFGFGNAETTGTLGVQFHFPVTMRVAPTVLDTSAMGTFWWVNGGTAGNTPTTLTMNANQTTTNLAYLQVNKTTSFTIGAMYNFAANNTSTAFIGVSAEL